MKPSPLPSCHNLTAKRSLAPSFRCPDTSSSQPIPDTHPELTAIRNDGAFPTTHLCFLARSPGTTARLAAMAFTVNMCLQGAFEVGGAFEVNVGLIDAGKHRRFLRCALGAALLGALCGSAAKCN